MTNKANKARHSKKNRKGHYLSEWRVFKKANLPYSVKQAENDNKNVVISNNCSTNTEVRDSVSSSSSNSVNSSSDEQLKSDTELTERLLDSDLFIEVQATPKSKHEEQSHENEVITGRRIIEIVYFIDELKKLNSHAPQFGCTLSNLTLCSEIKQGFRSGFVFQCNMCQFRDTVWTGPKNENAMNVNSAAVAGTISSGGGYAVLNKIMSAMNIRCISETSFARHEEIVSKCWEAAALEEMKLAADEEIALARERGDVDNYNVPLLTVVADGSWSKRSYRTNYNAMAGVVSM